MEPLKHKFKNMESVDLPDHIEWWDTDTIESDDARHTDREVEAFVHRDTATGARILEADDGTYSVQPSMGDYAGGDCVKQDDDPNTFVSGSATIIDGGLEDIAEARAMAFAWLKGWLNRNGDTFGREGAVVDARQAEWAEPIE